MRLITSLVRASDYRYCVCSSRRRPMEPTADRASTLHLLTPRLSRLRTMGYEVGRLNLESIQLLHPISSYDQAAYSVCGFSIASEEQTKWQFVASAEIFTRVLTPLSYCRVIFG